MSDDQLHEHLGHGDQDLLRVFSTGERSDEISVYDWHCRMGHCSMKTIVNMANSAVTGMVLKDIPADLPKLDSCLSCALAKAQCLPFKIGHTCYVSRFLIKYLALMYNKYRGLLNTGSE